MSKVLSKFPGEVTFVERYFIFNKGFLQFYGIHDGNHINSDIDLRGCSIQITESTVTLTKNQSIGTKTVTRQPLLVIDDSFNPKVSVAVDCKKIGHWATEISRRNHMPVTQTDVIVMEKDKFFKSKQKKGGRVRSNTLPSNASPIYSDHESVRSARSRKLSDASLESMSTGYIDLCGSTKTGSSSGGTIRNYDENLELDTSGQGSFTSDFSYQNNLIVTARLGESYSSSVATAR